MRTRRAAGWALWAAAGLGLGVAAQQPAAVPARPSQASFATPRAAAEALVAAAQAGNHAQLREILGPESGRLVPGDAVEERRELATFSAHARERLELRRLTDRRYQMEIGNDRWPFAIPITRAGAGWSFDTPAGVEEILARRIGDNENDAILTCQAYAQAQWEYFNGGPWEPTGIKQFAQKLVSTTGRKDGLYWETGANEELSPLGPLVAGAQAQGYRVPASGAGGNTHAYRGYIFRILKAQGPDAPGGRFRYVINGNMIAGFALVAFPASYAQSGVMTFIVNQQGRVYQKDLGPGGAETARAMVEYNPSPSWKLAEQP